MLAITAEDWGNIVRDRRRDMSLTQSELAARIGMSRQWVVGFENGRAGLASLEHLLRLMEALDLEAEVGA